MCTDYQSLNSNTVSNSWPLPQIDVGTVERGAIFSKLDLREGYH